MRSICLAISLILLPWTVDAQQYSTGSRRAVKLFEEAVVMARQMDRQGAEEALLKAIRADHEFLEAYQLLAQVCYEDGRMEEAIAHYSRTLEIDPEWNPEAYRLLAGMEYLTGNYRGGLELLERYFSYPPARLKNILGGEVLREKCRFALSALDHPVPFNPENLGDSVNSNLNEYWPCLSVDESTLMFTVMLPLEGKPDGGSAGYQEDFYVSHRANGAWSGRENAGSPLNTSDNEGAHSLTADGRYLFFTACNRRDGRGRCDIYMSERGEGNWTRPINLDPPVNTGYSEKHPTISADGRVLLFTSNRPGGMGNYDIWRSEWTGSGWSAPVNLGDSVNTAGEEHSPFLHPDGQTLYFSSTGWPGMGRGDLFCSRLGPDGSWSAPVNLGFPINTHNDEIGLSVNARGNRAYFASDRVTGKDTDIYTFELPEEVRPVLVSYLTGRVHDSRNMKGLSAVIQLIDLESEKVVVETASAAPGGEYLITLPTNRDYALNVSARGYLFSSEHFSFTGEHDRTEPFRRDIPLDRITTGTSVVLHNVFFDTDSDRLMPASVAELNKVVRFLEENPVLEVEIGGHTDNTGTEEHNQELSGKRAGAVVSFLTGKGIDADRLHAKGYGERKPLTGNETEKGRARNRRTELKIIHMRK